MKDNKCHGMERLHPLWGTQGGGLVREVNGSYIFVEKPPEFPELCIGDKMPKEWGIIPANDLASREAGLMDTAEWGA